MADDNRIVLHLALDSSQAEQNLNSLRSQNDTVQITVEADTNNVQQSMTSAAQAAQSVTAEASERIREILSDTGHTAASQASSIAQIYRSQGMEMSEAMQRAWEQVRNASGQTDQQLGRTASLAGRVRSQFQQIGTAARSSGEQTSSGMAIAERATGLLNSAVRKLSVTIAAAFSIQAIRSFINEAKEAWNVQLEAETKLETILGRNLGATNAQIQATKDWASALQRVGVIGDEVQLSGLQEISTYIENADSLKTMNVVLNDMLAQQYGLNATAESAVTISTMLGKVLEGQTSALSRYGYSFTEAQEKLLKYGTEEQRVATLAEVVEASVGGVNEALAQTPAGRMKQLSNHIGDIKENFGRAATNIQTLFLPVLNRVAGVLDSISLKAVEISEYFGGLLGVDLSRNITSAVSAANDFTDSLNYAKKAAEQLGAAGFDDFNIIGMPDTDSGTDDSADDQTLSVVQTAAQITDVSEQVDGLLAKLRNSPAVTAFWENFRKQTDRVDFSSIQENFSRIMEAFRPIAQAGLESSKDVFTSFSGFAGTMLGGIAGLTEKQIGIAAGGVASFLEKQNGKISKWVTSISKTISNGFINLNISADGIFDILFTALDNAKPDLEQGISDLLEGMSELGMGIGTITADMFEIATKKAADFVQTHSEEIGKFSENALNLFGEVQSFVGNVFKDISELLRDFWENSGKKIWENITEAAGDIGEFFLHIWNDILLPTFGNVKDEMERLWKSSLKPLWENVLTLFGSIGNALSLLWNNVIKPVLSWVQEHIFPVVRNVAASVISILGTVFEAVVSVFSNGIQMASAVLDFLTGIFTGDLEQAMTVILDKIQSPFRTIGDWFHDTFSEAWQRVLDVFSKGGVIFEGIQDGISGTFKNTVNSLIDGINSVLKNPFDRINSALNTLRAWELWTPWGDFYPFQWIPEVPMPQIPRLAKGGLVSQPTLAMVGDNANAQNDPEIISPLSKLRSMLPEGGQDLTLLEAKLDTLIQLMEMLIELVGEIDPCLVLGDKEVYTAYERGRRKFQKMKGV